MWVKHCLDVSPPPAMPAASSRPAVHRPGGDNGMGGDEIRKAPRTATWGELADTPHFPTSCEMRLVFNPVEIIPPPSDFLYRWRSAIPRYHVLPCRISNNSQLTTQKENYFLSNFLSVLLKRKPQLVTNGLLKPL